GPLTALGRPIERQVLRLALEIGDVLDPKLISLLLQHPDGVRARERRGVKSDQPNLCEVLLRLLDGLAGVARDVGRLDPEERGEGRARVLGITVELARLQRFESDLLRAVVEVLLDLVTGCLERLCIDLTEDEFL